MTCQSIASLKSYRHRQLPNGIFIFILFIMINTAGGVLMEHHWLLCGSCRCRVCVQLCGVLRVCQVMPSTVNSTVFFFFFGPLLPFGSSEFWSLALHERTWLKSKVSAARPTTARPNIVRDCKSNTKFAHLRARRAQLLCLSRLHLVHTQWMENWCGSAFAYQATTVTATSNGRFLNISVFELHFEHATALETQSNCGKRHIYFVFCRRTRSEKKRAKSSHFVCWTFCMPRHALIAAFARFAM